MKKPLTIFKQGMVIALRNNIMIYSMAFTILAAIVLKIFLPTINNNMISFVVDKNVNSQIGENLKQYGVVEVFENIDEVKARVGDLDDVVGVVKVKEDFEIILEGNEISSLKELAPIIISEINDKTLKIPIEYKSLSQKKNFFIHFSVILLAISAVVIGGLILGFTVVEEKESNVIKAFAVSAVKWREYLFGKSIIVIILSLILSVVPALILLVLSVDYLKLIFGVIISVSFGLLFGFIIGGFADNLMSAIALMKTLFFLFLGIPMVAIFVPEHLQWVLYPFPNYWSFRMFKSFIIDGEGWIQFLQFGGLTLLLTLIIFMPFYNIVKRRLNLT